MTEPDEYAGIPAEAGAADVGRLARAELERWTMERASSSRSRRARRPRRATRWSAMSRTRSTRTARARRARQLGRLSLLVRAHPGLRIRVRLRRRGPRPHDGHGVGVARGPDASIREAIGHEAADRALALHGARQPASRRCPVVLDPYVAASFASTIGGTLSADAVQRGRSLFAGKEGERDRRRASRLFDDGLDPEGLATAPFDGEGMPQQRTPLIEEGTLRDVPLRHLHGAPRERASTGNGRAAPTARRRRLAPTNLLVDAGRRSHEELLRAAGDGFYVMASAGCTPASTRSPGRSRWAPPGG